MPYRRPKTAFAIFVFVVATTVLSIIVLCNSFVVPSSHRLFFRHVKRNQNTRIKDLAFPKNAAAVCLSEYLDESNETAMDSELKDLVLSIASSCLEISNRLRTLSMLMVDNDEVGGGGLNIQGEEQKPMDVIANDIFVQNILSKVAAAVSEEEDTILYGNSTKKYEISFDPLDGSSNLDVCIPTGSIFGVGLYDKEAPFSKPGRDLILAGYALYSSSTELIISFGHDSVSCDENTDGCVVGFTLDPIKANNNNKNNAETAFWMSRRNIICPPSGPYYSLNEAREPDWPDGLRRWISDAKRGITPSGKIYSSRYICSLCGDFHRTLLKGGWAGNPRPHLRLLYEAAPMAFVVQAAGGKGSDGTKNILDIQPKGIHDRTPLFLGSKEDILDVEGYGDVQQKRKKYET